MEGSENIFSLAKKVLQNKLSLHQAVESLSSNKYKPYLNEKVILEASITAEGLRAKALEPAYVIAVLSYEASKITEDFRLQAFCALILGNVLRIRGQYRESITFFQKALIFFEEKDEKEEINVALENIGCAYMSLGDYLKAITYFQRCLDIAQVTGNREGVESILGNLGSVYFFLGDYPRSIDYNQKALEKCKALRDRRGEGIHLNNLGLVYRCLGDFSIAIDLHQQALKIFREIEDRMSEGTTLNNLGIVFRGLRNYLKAIDYYESAMKVSLEVGDRQGQARTLGNLSNIYSAMEDYPKAIEFQRQALEIVRNINDRRGEENCLGNLGNAYFSLKNYGRAIECYQQALNISRNIRDRSSEAIALANLGNVYFFLRDHGKGIEYYQQALGIAREMGTVDLQREFLGNLGAEYDENLKQNGVAYKYYKRSIELAEKIRGRIKEEEHRTSFFGHTEDVFDSMIILCNRMKTEQKTKLVESFEYLERAKSRTFLESLAHTSFKYSKLIPAELIEKENELLSEIRSMYRSSDSQQKVALTYIQKLESELDTVWNKIEKIEPEYVAMRRGKPLNFLQIQQLIKSQVERVCLVEYFHTKDKLLIFILQPYASELKIKEIDLPTSKFDYYLKQYADEFMITRRDIGQTWQNLSRYLIDPILEYLDGVDIIYFVPHRLVHYLPLHALRYNGEYLIVKYKIAYSPSASVISYCQNKRRDKKQSCLSLGVVFEEEASRVAEIFKENSFVYKGPHVTKNLIEKESKGKDIIHFSCHGFFHPQIPVKSGLVLAKNEILTVEDIFQLELDTNLVTLSACQTGINEQKPGDDLVGLTRSFIYAGTPSIVVSLWSVSAGCTIELMEKFYSYLKGGKTKVESLQRAQLDIMKNPKYSHPYFWAPFILVGDWK